MRRLKPKIRWGALVSLLVTGASAVTAALASGVTQKSALIGVGIGAILQAATKPVARKEEERYTNR